MVLAGLFAGVSFLTSRLMQPPRPTAAKTSAYECGVITHTDAPERFPVKFYLLAMIFVVFDIELIFLYPFSLIFDEIGVAALVDILVFSGVVFIPFAYLVSHGVLDWGPAQVRKRSSVAVSPQRTTTTTIRRVGSEGRLPTSSTQAA